MQKKRKICKVSVDLSGILGLLVQSLMKSDELIHLISHRDLYCPALSTSLWHLEFPPYALCLEMLDL